MSNEQSDGGTSGISNLINTSCSICLQEMQSEENLRELHCGHLFHEDCVVHWFTTSGTKRCPICRFDEERGTPAETGQNFSNGRLIDVTDFDLDLDDLFGNFQTEDGGSIFIYEGPRGIIMIRMLNVNIPTGTQLVRLPVRPSTRAVARTVRRMMFPRTRSLLKRTWNKMKSCFGRNNTNSSNGQNPPSVPSP